MSRLLIVMTAFLALTACQPRNVAEFWRPISEPNIQLPLDRAQLKLDYDLSQCNCGIFPRNIPLPLQAQFDADKQRLVETGVTAVETQGQCMRQPSLIVAECMRARGWEVTRCSGRMPTAGAGAVCAQYGF